MGVEIVKCEVVTCDICNQLCGKHDGHIKEMVNAGDGRDVGPAYVKATLTFYQPYGCSNGLVCTDCKIKYLESHLKAQKGVSHAV